MDEYQRGLQEQNALRGLDPAAADYLAQVKKVNPKLGFEFGKLMQEGDKEQALTLKAKNEALKFSLDNSRSFLVGVNDQPAYDAWRAYSVKNVPELEKMLPSVFTPEAKDGLLKTADDISKRLTAAPPAPTNIANLIRERNALPQGDPSRKLYDQQINDLGAANRNAQQRLAFDQAKFAWEKANPTKSIQNDETGLVAVDTRTGTATPVVYGANGIQTAPAAPSVTVDGRSFPGLRTEIPVSRAGTQVPGKGAGAPTEGERKAATLLQRLQGSQNQLTQALLDDPTAAGPEAFAAAVGKLSTTGANLLNSEERQRVEAAQLDILDAALTLGTGAAYTREQLEGYRQSYFPIYGDKPKNIKDKQARLQNVIDAANIAAGKAGKLVPKPPPVTGGSDVRSAADNILKGK
jgi:hypothetical protein